METKPGILPLHITCTGQFSGAHLQHVFDLIAIPGNAAWPSASRAYYIPLTMPAPFQVARWMWSVGTQGAQNVDLGLFSDVTGGPGILLNSTGGTANNVGGSTAVHYAAPSAGTKLYGPGKYWMAMVCDSVSTSTFSRIAPAFIGTMKMAGIRSKATQYPLADSPAASTVAGLYIPIFGFTQSSTL